AADRDRCRRAWYARRAIDRHAGNTSLERVDEIVALGFRDLLPTDSLLGGAERAHLRRLAERRDHHSVEARRNALELDIDHIFGAHQTLFRSSADVAELQHLPGIGTNA